MTNFNYKTVVDLLNKNELDQKPIIVTFDPCPKLHAHSVNLAKFPALRSQNNYPVVGNIDSYIDKSLVNQWHGIEAGIQKAAQNHIILIAPMYKNYKLFIQICIKYNYPVIYYLPENIDDIYSDYYKTWVENNILVSDYSKEMIDNTMKLSPYLNPIDIDEFYNFINDNNLHIPVYTENGKTDADYLYNNFKSIDRYPTYIRLISKALKDGYFIDMNLFK